MKAAFLPQAVMVEKLLSAVTEALPKIADEELRLHITDLLEEFKEAITPSAIYLSEVHDYAALQGAVLTDEAALKILRIAANDIDSNYTSKAIEYHVDEYVLQSERPL